VGDETSNSCNDVTKGCNTRKKKKHAGAWERGTRRRPNKNGFKDSKKHVRESNNKSAGPNNVGVGLKGCGEKKEKNGE